MESDQSRRTSAVPSWVAIALLLALALGLRLWIVARTEVAARDSIGFIRTALRFENESWIDVVRSSEQPPGYALVVLTVSWPVRAIAGATTCDTMVLSAQLASVLMGVLSIIPLARLGREIGDRRVGWLAAGFTLTLPGLLRLTSDGLSEATFLFFVATALWLGVRALRRPSVMRMALCGVAVAAAYLTRPEGLELAIAAAVALIALQFTARRQPWRRVGGQMAGLACGVLVGVVPYVAVTGQLTNKNTAKVMIGAPGGDPSRLVPYGKAEPPAASRSILAVWMQESGGAAGPRWWWTIKALASETTQSLQYYGFALALLGAGVLRFGPRSMAGRFLIGTLVALHVAVLLRMASLSGYLSERHTLYFVVAACVPAAAGLLWLGTRLRPAAGFAVACCLLGFMIAGTLPSISKPLHGNRSGHKAAGRFLAEAVTPEDKILDPFNWAEFYARPVNPLPAPAKPRRWFVVLEAGDNPHSRLPALADARRMAEYGTLVYSSPATGPKNSGVVHVYEVTRSQIGQ